MDTVSMSRDGLRVAMREGGVAVLEMDVPGRRNAMSAPLRTALIGAVEAAAGDAAVAGIVITGAGGHFCAGGDLQRLVAMAPADLPDMLRSGHRLLRAIATAPKPVIVASTTEFTKFDCSCSERVSEAFEPSTAATELLNVVSEVSADVAAEAEETDEAVKAENAVCTVDPDVTVNVEAEVSDKNVLAAELFEIKFTPL